jgi:hypothetical protein
MSIQTGLPSRQLPVEQRPNVQGTTDVSMGFAGATAGLLSGVVVAAGSYAVLALLAAALILPLLTAVLRAARAPLPRTSADAPAG